MLIAHMRQVDAAGSLIMAHRSQPHPPAQSYDVGVGNDASNVTSNLALMHALKTYSIIMGNMRARLAAAFQACTGQGLPEVGTLQNPDWLGRVEAMIKTARTLPEVSARFDEDEEP